MIEEFANKLFEIFFMSIANVLAEIFMEEQVTTDDNDKKLS